MTMLRQVEDRDGDNDERFDSRKDSDERRDEDYDDDDEEEEEEEEDSSFWSELMASWHQHAVAILIAVVAATMGYYHLQSVKDTLFAMENAMTGTSHEHVHSHQRIANISFCEPHDDDDSANNNNNNNHLVSLEFRIPKDLVPIMSHHCRVDELGAEEPTPTALIQDGKDDDPLARHHESLCMRMLQESPATESKTYITGYTHVYKTPSLPSILGSSNNDGKQKQTSLSFTGFGAKFFNLSPKPVLLHWDGRGGRADSARLIAEIPPMESVGTATTPGQSFSISPVYDHSHAMKRWVLTEDFALVVYEDVPDDENALSPELRLRYRMHKLSLRFHKDYLVVSGRHWLANFPRPPPIHFVWPANVLGQKHRVTSFVNYLLPKSPSSAPPQKPLDLTLEVSSVAPRVFTIENFLSAWECQHLIRLVKEQGELEQSYVVAGSHSSSHDTMTRSSTNGWLERHQDPVVDAVYRRGADVMGLDESLFRHRSYEHLELPTHHSIAESLQVVHYSEGQEYTPHHDFTYPPVSDRYQATRFATLLMYLNNPREGGETKFPRAVQPSNHDGLVVKPERGKAILFYNILPDGNMDDLSQHGSSPVIKGEKWVANLWVWDPIIG